MYVSSNPKSKKALKEAIKAGKHETVYNPGLGGDPPANGVVSVEGPHYPAAHSWYARVTLKDGIIVSVK